MFERVRADYVEKPEDTKLIESAINGMLSGLDPHSSYMEPKAFRDMQVQTRGEFGAPDGLGGSEKGLSIASRASAEVTAPCDGWVVYAGPLRSYGQLLILNAGGGYHVLLMGMQRISVDPGQFVLTGEPVAVMESGGQVAAAAATTTPSQPVLYIEFRKDGTPIDPGPWWATSESEKVRG